MKYGVQWLDIVPGYNAPFVEIIDHHFRVVGTIQRELYPEVLRAVNNYMGRPMKRGDIYDPD